jgi:hypothetical protein
MCGWSSPLFMTGKAVNGSAGINYQLDGKTVRVGNIHLSGSIMTGRTVIEVNAFNFPKVTNQIIRPTMAV